MLRDCAHIQQQEAEWKNRKARRHSGTEKHEPPYTMEDAQGTIGLLVPCEYGGAYRGLRWNTDPFYGYRAPSGFLQH